MSAFVVKGTEFEIVECAHQTQRNGGKAYDYVHQRGHYFVDVERIVNSKQIVQIKKPNNDYQDVD